MDMDAEKVFQLIGRSRRFLSPFSEPCGYYIWTQEPEGQIEKEFVELYWEKLGYAAENADALIGQAVRLAYENAEIRMQIGRPFEKTCQELIFESFVLNPADKEIGSCLSNPDFMAGHYIECRWDFDWELVGLCYC